MKKALKSILTLSLLSMTLFTNAQIKVHSDNHISIGSLTQRFGIQLDSNKCTSFERSNNPDWSWITVAQTTNTKSKCWIVRNVNTSVIQPFYVTGGGVVYRTGEVAISDSRFQENTEGIDDPSGIIDQLSGFYYDYTEEMSERKDGKRKVGFSAQEIEKFLPEAVESDENGALYLNYDVLTVFLVETVKKQNKEIQEMRSVLEKNGLIH